jgi:tetratricopeptide (TPR) repeat protein
MAKRQCDASKRVDRTIVTMRWTRRRSMAALFAAAWSGAARTQGLGPNAAPLFDGMGAFEARGVSSSATARRYMAQGLVLGWGFNPAEAARSFAGALQHDPACAAAWWGRAWALGPSINADMAGADVPAVAEALQRARALSAAAPARWRGLIEAMAARHPRPDAAQVDEAAYERRMKDLFERFPADADVAVFAAEALMNLHPYDWWNADGHAQPWTPAIERRLQRALALAPDHPGANHAWVHLMESSAAPQRARAEADRLRDLVPGSGHLLHMPAHIDMRLGRYAAAVQANERAIAADARYLEQVDAQGAYRVGYVAHNHHFLWAAASMQGASARAIAAADTAYGAACGPRAPERGTRAAGTLQHFQVLPLFARLRFGRWHELLSEVRPPDGDGAYALAVWHHARGTALARSGRVAEARQQLERLRAVAQRDDLSSTRIKSVHAASALVEIARLTLQADLALSEGRFAVALSDLRRTVQIEDALEHDEPHLWLAPTRHAYGAALLAAGRTAEAERVFEQDLRHYPDNGWSLAGLRQAQQLQGRVAAARDTDARARAAWREADTPLPGPRF